MGDSLRVPLRKEERLGSLTKALLQVRIAMDSGLDFRETVAGGQDGVKVRLDRRRDTGSFKPFGAIKWIGCDGAPEPGGMKQGRNAFGVLTLKETNQIGGYTHLKAMKAGPFTHAIQRMRNEMLASAGGTGGTADRHGNAVQ